MGGEWVFVISIKRNVIIFGDCIIVSLFGVEEFYVFVKVGIGLLNLFIWK